MQPLQPGQPLPRAAQKNNYTIPIISAIASIAILSAAFYCLRYADISQLQKNFIIAASGSLTAVLIIIGIRSCPKKAGHSHPPKKPPHQQPPLQHTTPPPQKTSFPQSVPQQTPPSHVQASQQLSQTLVHPPSQTNATSSYGAAPLSLQFPHSLIYKPIINLLDRLAAWLKSQTYKISISYPLIDLQTPHCSSPIICFGIHDKIIFEKEFRQFNPLAVFGRHPDFDFLSNYDPCSFTAPNGESVFYHYASTECYYQSNKFLISSISQKIQNQGGNPSEIAHEIACLQHSNSARDTARSYTTKYGLKDCFKDASNELDLIMKIALFCKFVDTKTGMPTEMGMKLLNTGDRLLIEGNDRGKNSDVLWGCKLGFNKQDQTVEILEGENKLGKMLMELRDMLRGNFYCLSFFRC